MRGQLAAEGYEAVADHVARLARFEWVDAGAVDSDVIATVPIPGGGVQVLPSEAFDAEEARQRIEKKRAALVTEMERAEKKLANEKFVAKAPPAVVDEERRKLAEYRDALANLEG